MVYERRPCRRAQSRTMNSMVDKLSGETVRIAGTKKPTGEVVHVLGSGTALVAFSRHDRRYVGIETLEVRAEASWVSVSDWKKSRRAKKA